MKNIIIILAFIFVNNILFAQTRTSYEVCLDSLPIQSFSLASKGSINIKQKGKSVYDKMTITYVLGKRTLNNYKYNSLRDFNASDFTSQIRAAAKSGGRLMIEFDATKTSEAVLFILPVVD